MRWVGPPCITTSHRDEAQCMACATQLTPLSAAGPSAGQLGRGRASTDLGENLGGAQGPPGADRWDAHTLPLYMGKCRNTIPRCFGTNNIETPTAGLRKLLLALFRAPARCVLTVRCWAQCDRPPKQSMTRPTSLCRCLRQKHGSVRLSLCKLAKQQNSPNSTMSTSMSTTIYLFAMYCTNPSFVSELCCLKLT